jgi:hypothetical protein
MTDDATGTALALLQKEGLDASPEDLEIERR